MEKGKSILRFARHNRLHSGNVLHNEISRFQPPDNVSEVKHELVTSIVKRPSAYEAESLAGRSAYHGIQCSVPLCSVMGGPSPSSRIRDSLASKGGYVCTHDLSTRKIELVHSRGYRIVLNGGEDVEARLLESQGQASCA
jgi:hypothetical protein